MWNRRKEEEHHTLKPASAPPTSSELAKEGIPMSTLPGRISGEPHFDAHRGGQAVLGKSVIVKGQIFSREDLTIDGEVEGTVDLGESRLTIAPQGRVQADMKAREIIIEGTVRGTAHASDRLHISKSGNVSGDLVAARVSIEDGAYFKGSIDIQKPDEQKAAKVTGESYRATPTPLAAVSKDKLQ